MNGDKKTLMIIDSNALIHRAYHALPGLTAPDGTLVNAVYGFCLIFFKAISEINPDYIVAAFDVKGKTFRHDEFADYKATREKKADNFYAQIPMVKDVLKSMGVLVLEKEGFEADDVIGTIAEKSKNQNVETIVVTGDLDTLQLLRSDLKVWALKVGISNSVVYDIDKFKERYDLEVDQFVDFKALKGDPSDNIPGVAGIGDKTAASILQKHGSLDNLYKDIDGILADPMISSKDKKLYTKLKEAEDEARFSQHLSMIKKDVDVDFDLEKSKFVFDSKEKTAQMFREFGFSSLIPKLNMNMVVHTSKKDENKNKKTVKICDNLEQFKSNLKHEKLFVFDNGHINESKDGFLLFYEKEESFVSFFVDAKNIKTVKPILQDRELITFDAKSLYYKH